MMSRGSVPDIRGYKPEARLLPPRSRIKWLSTVTTALANFAAQYNFQSIAVSLLIMSVSQCTLDEAQCKDGQQQAWVKGTASAVIFIGAVVGQLSMGFLGDYMSRNVALATTLSISAISALLSAATPMGSPSTVYASIILCRFVIGIGLGGIYPLSATKASEDSASTADKTNSLGPAFAFIWQVPGLLAPWLLALLMTYGDAAVSVRWRLVLGLGAVPAGLAVCALVVEEWYNRSDGTASTETSEAAVPERTVSSPDTTSDGRTMTFTIEEVDSDPPPAPLVPPAATFLTLSEVGRRLQHGPTRDKLLVCGGTWLLYDIVFYGLSLLGGVVLSSMATDDDDISSDRGIRHISGRQAIALSASMVPIVLSVFLLRKLSLKALQVLGFLVQAGFLLLFVALYSHLQHRHRAELFALYCLTLMSLQLGVPITTYALPASVFDKDIRCTFNGIASAMGKIGAIIGAYAFPYVAEVSIHAVLVICVATCLLGAYLTHYFIDDAMLLQNDESTAGSVLSMGIAGSGSGGGGGGGSGRASLWAAGQGSERDEVVIEFSPLPNHSVHGVA